jgi:hypothetical protein
MTRNEWLAGALSRYLDRRTIPQGFKDKPEALRDEAQALVRALIRLAPVDGYQEWCGDFIDKLAMDAQTRAWPTQGEMQAAAKALRKSAIRPFDVQSQVKFDPLAIAAKRIRSGEAVGDEYLWGRCCVEMQRAHGVTDEELKPYRSAVFFADKDMVDESGALEREAHRKALHGVAKQKTWEGERGGRSVPDAARKNIA